MIVRTGLRIVKTSLRIVKTIPRIVKTGLRIVLYRISPVLSRIRLVFRTKGTCLKKRSRDACSWAIADCVLMLLGFLPDSNKLNILLKKPVTETTLLVISATGFFICLIFLFSLNQKRPPPGGGPIGAPIGRPPPIGGRRSTSLSPLLPPRLPPLKMLSL